MMAMFLILSAVIIVVNLGQKANLNDDRLAAERQFGYDWSMRILLIGASGTIGKRIYDRFAKKHDVVQASRTGADVEVDITDTASIENMYKSVENIDAVICAAGPAKFGAFS